MTRPSASTKPSLTLRRQMTRSRLFPDLTTPARIGRFEVDAVLGMGTMGTVFKAHDPQLDRAVAIKVLQGDAGQGAKARLLREARALAQVNHPHVITIFDVGAVDGQPFIAMEFVPGQTLRTWVDGQSQRAILDAYCAAARGLGAIHAAGLVHRDFKPANVLVNREGGVHVADFGLVRGSARTPTAAPKDAAGLDWTGTQTGAVLGTPAYMAPEQVAGGEIGPAADQFAFCVALYEALTGSLPQAHRTGEPLPRAGLSRALHRALARGMALDPAQRWPDMAALTTAVRRRRWRAPLLVFGILACVMGAVFLGQAPSTQTNTPDSAPESSASRPAIAPLLKSDPALAARVLAQTEPSDAWVEQAWSALHRPHAFDRLPAPSAMVGALAQRGRMYAQDDGIAFVWQAERWQPMALPGQFVKQLRQHARTPSQLQDAWVSARDWANRPWLAVEPTFFINQAGWLLTWQNDHFEPLMPTPAPVVQQVAGCPRVLMYTPGAEAWSVPLDGALPRLLMGLSDVRGGTCSAALDALALGDGTVWLLPPDAPARQLDRLPAPPDGLRFSPDGRWLLAFGPNPRIWHMDGAHPAFDPPGRWRGKGVFNDDSTAVALARNDNAIVEYDLITHIERVAHGHTAEVRVLEPHAEGWMSAADDGTVRIWRMRAGTKMGQLPGVWSGSADARGERIVLTGRGGVVSVFDVRTGTETARRVHPAKAYVARFSAAGDAILSGAADGVARMWPLKGGPPIELPGHDTWAYGVAFSPDGAQLATADRNGVVRLWTRDGRLLRNWQPDYLAPIHRVHVLAFSAAGDALIWGHRHGPVYWAPLEGPARVLSAQHGALKQTADGQFITFGAMQTVHWYDARGGERRVFDVGASVSQVFPTPDARQVAIATTDRHIHFRPENPSKPRCSIAGPAGGDVPHCVRLSAVVGEPTTRQSPLRGSLLENPSKPRRFGPLPGVVEFAAFSPDGRQIALGYPNGTVELMTVATGRRWPLGAHAGAIRAVFWTQPEHVITASIDGAVRRWDVRRDPDALRARLQAATRICLTANERQTWLAEPVEIAQAAARRCREARVREKKDRPTKK